MRTSDPWVGVLRTDERIVVTLFTGIFICLAMFATFTRNINWDEFHFLAQVYQYHQGRLSPPLQTFHVHLFGWLTLLPVSGISQVIVGRIVMLVLELGSLCALFVIARYMFCVRTAVIVVAGYICSGFVVEHGASFRSDPLVVFAMMGSLAILVSRSLTWRWAALAAFLAAIGLLVSIKASFYLPAFLGAFIWRWHRDGLRPSVVNFAGAGAFLLLSYSLMWMLHVSSLEVAEALTTSRSNAGSALRKTAMLDELFPREYYIRIWLRESSLFASFLVLGAAFSIYDLVRGNRARAVAVLLFAVPIISIVFYRNAYPYFFPFILPPVALLAGIAAVRFARPVLVFVFVVLDLLMLVGQAPRYLVKEQLAQRALLEAAQSAFPEPVPYIDRAGMVPSYPKVGYFMSSWGIEAALASGGDKIKEAIYREQPKFVIANAPSLVYALTPADGPAPKLRLTQADEQSLRDNFIKHWGDLWVAGKILGASATPSRFEMVIGGLYTVECTLQSVTIDGQEVVCGRTVDLNAGNHTIAASEDTDVTLRIGKNLPRPDAPEPEGPVFHRL